MKILFVASEAYPYALSGGLGDVAGALPKALSRAGHEVKIVMPLYRRVDRAKHQVRYRQTLCVHMGTGEVWCGLHSCDHGDGVETWFIDREDMFGRAGLYDENGQSYDDNLGRFAFFGKAALQACKDMGWTPDVLHAHDWQSAPAVIFRKTWDAWLSPLSNTACVMTIHNIGYQGQGDGGVMEWMGLGPEHYTSDKLEEFGGVNFLKGGIYFADAITTVSPTHASEIREPIGGKGLAPYLNNRASDLFGILNGVDYSKFDPQNDRFLPYPFDVGSMEGRALDRRELQKRLNLHQDPVPLLVGCVSRYAPGKGFELVAGMMERAIRDMHIQVVALGSGDYGIESLFWDLTQRYPGRVSNWIGYDEGLSHQIYGGIDLFLMPSAYEPCGLAQMYALRYGAVPLVRSTGGLADSIENYREHDGGGTGFVFHDYTPDALYYTLGWAASTYFDRPDHFRAMQRRGMEQRFTWEKAVPHYEDVYRHALARIGR